MAPKIIGGDRAPTPVGELGFVEMTQAVQLVDQQWEISGPDMMCHGYLTSSSGGLEYIDEQMERKMAAPNSVVEGKS